MTAESIHTQNNTIQMIMIEKNDFGLCFFLLREKNGRIIRKKTVKTQIKSNHLNQRDAVRLKCVLLRRVIE